jgi:cell wall assembly regulator SMI1
MITTVDESWNRIVNWLDRHAPQVAAGINPPATESALEQAEAAMLSPLPADLVAWWRHADGMRGTVRLLPPGFVPYSVERALEARRIWLSVGGEESELPPGRAGSPCDVWLPVWMPIAGDGCGADLFVDLREGPAYGCVMEYDKVAAAGYEDPSGGDVALWPSVAAMLADVAGALEHEVPVGGLRIWVDDDGTISWDDDASRWSDGGAVRVDVASLRERYAAFAAEVRAGRFDPPPAGSWPAEWIAAHVARNTELLIATTEAVLAVDPVGREQQRAAAWAAQDLSRLHQLWADEQRAVAGIRYDNSDAMDPETLARHATSGLAALAVQIEQLGARLCDLIEPLNRGRPSAHVRIVDAGTTVVDSSKSWLGMLNALSTRQLPLRTRQLRALR